MNSKNGLNNGVWSPPDDLDDVILGRMIKEAGVFYKMELERVKGVE